MPKPLILIVDDDAEVREALGRSMKRWGYSVRSAADLPEARERLSSEEIDLLLTDLRLPGGDGMELVRLASSLSTQTAVIVLTGYGSVESAVEAMRAGAYDYLTKPVNPEELKIQTERALERKRLRDDVADLRRRLDERLSVGNIVAASPPMKRVLDTVEHLAGTEVTVLITGPSGVGKELIADAIQHRSERRDGPYLKLHCAALAEGVLESELFGHERGAFTGAVKRHAGAFERADGGTLFLDEIGELPAATQVKLLRVLQDQRFERVGGEQTLQVDVRLLVATNKNLLHEVEKGNFRDDLFYRLKVVQLDIPPLSERTEDLLPMIGRFIAEAAERNRRKVRGASPEVLEHFAAYDWPGNVRELRNTIEGMVALARGEELTPADLPPEIRGRVERLASTGEIRVPVGWTMQQIEREAIRKTLAANDGNRTRTAEALGIGLRTLHRKIREYDLR